MRKLYVIKTSFNANLLVWRVVPLSAPFWSSTFCWELEAGLRSHSRRDGSACSRPLRSSSPRCLFWGEAWQPEPAEQVSGSLLLNTSSLASRCWSKMAQMCWWLAARKFIARKRNSSQPGVLRLNSLLGGDNNYAAVGLIKRCHNRRVILGHQGAGKVTQVLQVNFQQCRHLGGWRHKTGVYRLS